MTIQWGSMPMRPMQTIIQAIAMRARPMQIMKKNISIAVLCSLLICGNSAFAQRDRSKSPDATGGNPRHQELQSQT